MTPLSSSNAGRQAAGVAATAAPRPFITVAIPTYQRPRMIRRAIESIQAQDYQNWDLVVSDDEGPQGETWAVIGEYARHDPRIRAVENEGQGEVDNTNNAMLASRGKWIKLLHDDDWLASGGLTRFAEVAEKYPSAAFMMCASNVVRDNGVHIHADPKEHDRILLFTSQQCLKDLYLARMTRSLGIVPSTLLINSEVISSGCRMLSHKSLQGGIDQFLFVELARRGEMVIIDEGLIYYDGTLHEGVTGSKRYRDVDEITLAVKRHNWSLIENRKGLPTPEALVRALRVARIPNRFAHQSLLTSARDAMQILNPSVMKIAAEYLRDYLFLI